MFLFIDAQYEKIRELEKPLLKNIIQKHNEINQAFRKTYYLHEGTNGHWYLFQSFCLNLIA
jgi:uncharacterized protein YllA (UPF0747 family)